MKTGESGLAARWFLFSTVGVLLLALLLRTWVVLGFVEPVEVAGSSMAPTLCGPHGLVGCQRCGAAFVIGAEFAAAATWCECPNCGHRQELPADLPIHRGDRLLIDRTSFEWRLPRRWEPVVFVSPADAGRLAVKRVVGLPGETVTFAQGDLWIDGQRVRKSLSEQRALRQLVHRETAQARAWHPTEDGAWEWHHNAWQSASRQSTGDLQWLQFGDPQQPIHDDSSYNAGLSQQLHDVPDLCVSAGVQLTGQGKLAVRWPQEQLLLNLTTGQITLRTNSIEQDIGRLSSPVLDNLQHREVQVEFSNFDRQLLLAIEGQVVACVSLAALSDEGTSECLLAVGTSEVALSLRDLCVWRDVYYVSTTELLGKGDPPSQVRLAPDELYLLGDNVPVSLDSRRFGPLPMRFLVGKPVGVR